MRGAWPFIGIAVVCVAALIGAYQYWKKPAPTPKAPSKQQVVLPSGSEIVLNGRIQAASLLKVMPPIDGVVEEISVKAGEEVYEGQILGKITNSTLVENEREASLEAERAQIRLNTLESELIAARLEDSRLAAELSRARTSVSKDEKTYQRQSVLKREGATPRMTYEKAASDFESSKRELDSAQALSAAMQDKIQKIVKDIESARKTLAEAQEAHDNTKESLAAANLTSPADGLVTAVKKNAGEDVTKGGDGIIEIAVELGRLTVVLEPEPQFVARLKAGDPALVVLAEVPGDGVPGTVKSVEGGNVVVEFSSPTPLVRPGATASVRLKLR